MAYLPQLEQLHGDALRLHVDDEGTRCKVDELLAGAGPDTELYMCGPIRLMDAVKRGWDARGLAGPNLRFETFGNSGWYDPEEFVVRVPRLGVEATVGPGTSMLEALEGAGVDMMFDCRKGECGLCEVRRAGAAGLHRPPRRLLQRTPAAGGGEDVLLRLAGRQLRNGGAG